MPHFDHLSLVMIYYVTNDKGIWYECVFTKVLSAVHYKSSIRQKTNTIFLVLKDVDRTIKKRIFLFFF